MGSVNYFLQVNIAFSVLLVFYLALLRSSTRFALNRAFLLVAAAAPLFYPLLQIQQGGTMANVFVLREITISASPGNMLLNDTGTNWLNMMVYVYITGAGIAFTVLVYRLYLLYRLVRHARPLAGTGTWLLPEGHPATGFSLLNRVYIQPGLPAHEQEIITRHEQVHVCQKHYLDIIFFEMLCIVFWFNPLYRLAKKQVMATHEFIADEQAGCNNAVHYAQILVARALRLPGTFFNSFSQTNLLKRRLRMLTQQKSGKVILLRYALAIPLAVAVLSVQSFSFRVVNNSVAPVKAIQADENASFNGDMTAYLVKTIKYPEEARKQNITGKVYVAFIVSETGTIKDVTVKRGVHDLLDKEAVRVVSAMPAWKPATKDGKAVSAEMILPIAFQL